MLHTLERYRPVNRSRSEPTMSRRAETVVVGAGQAGLALSRCLTDLGRDHIVLERGRVGERWHSERWDSFRLLTPNWHTRLPGHRYAGPDPDGFMDATELTTLFRTYARSFDAPIRTGEAVHAVRADGAGWRVSTPQQELRATNVVLATGPHALPRVPRLGARFPGWITQMTPAGYRNPDQLPAGGVLVVGAGPTGQQLASELARAGRRVHLAVGRHQRLPRTYRGRDAFWWLDRMGITEQTVDSLPDRAARRPVHPVLSGGRELGLDVLVTEGVVPVGRLLAVDGSRVHLDDRVADRYLDAELAAERFTSQADAFVARTGMTAPPAAPPPPRAVPAWAIDPPQTLDLRAAGIRTVLWATGYRPDHRWVHAPVFDRRGEPVHRRGVTAMPGLYFIGLTWLYRRKSASIDGVGDDAAHLARHIDRRARHRMVA